MSEQIHFRRLTDQHVTKESEYQQLLSENNKEYHRQRDSIRKKIQNNPEEAIRMIDGPENRAFLTFALLLMYRDVASPNKKQNKRKNTEIQPLESVLITGHNDNVSDESPLDLTKKSNKVIVKVELPETTMRFPEPKHRKRNNTDIGSKITHHSVPAASHRSAGRTQQPDVKPDVESMSGNIQSPKADDRLVRCMLSQIPVLPISPESWHRSRQIPYQLSAMSAMSNSLNAMRCPPSYPFNPFDIPFFQYQLRGYLPHPDVTHNIEARLSRNPF